MEKLLPVQLNKIAEEIMEEMDGEYKGNMVWHALRKAAEKGAETIQKEHNKPLFPQA